MFNYITMCVLNHEILDHNIVLHGIKPMFLCIKPLRFCRSSQNASKSLKIEREKGLVSRVLLITLITQKSVR